MSYTLSSESKRKQIRRKLLGVCKPDFDFSNYHSNFIKNNNLEVIECYKTTQFHFAIVRDLNTTLLGVFSYSEVEKKCVIPIDFDYIEFNYSNGFNVGKNNLYNIYSYIGTLILPIWFNFISVEKNLITVKKGDLYGLYSLSGILILPTNFVDIIIKGDLIIVKKELFLAGVYSISLSKFIIPIKYDNIQILSDYIIASTRIDRYKTEESYYDFSGKFIKSQIEEKPPKYDRSDILEGIYMGWW